MSKLPNPEKFDTLPLSKVDEAVLGQNLPFYKKWLTRTTSKDWTGFNYESDLRRVKIPALNISGWWDGDEIGTMLNWQIMRSLHRPNQYLVYGPWTHLFNSNAKIGDTDFGPTAVIDLDSVYLRWFDTWLKHKSVKLEKQPRVRAFITGSNKWVESADWPLAQSKPMTLYLSATGPAEGTSSKGSLEPQVPERQDPTKYRFDPHNVVIDPKVLNPDPDKISLKVDMPKHTAGLELFQSAPMKDSMSVAGPIVFDLRFSTSAEDTDFFVNLVDLDEKGQMSSIGQAGKIRCSYLDGLDKQRALKPGRIYAAKIRLWDTAHEFAKGHRLCLMLSSTEFPLFARNLGTIDPIATATKMVIQDQKIYHDRQNPSSITFQVVKG